MHVLISSSVFAPNKAQEFAANVECLSDHAKQHANAMTRYLLQRLKNDSNRCPPASSIVFEFVKTLVIHFDITIMADWALKKSFPSLIRLLYYPFYGLVNYIAKNATKI